MGKLIHIFTDQKGYFHRLFHVECYCHFEYFLFPHSILYIYLIINFKYVYISIYIGYELMSCFAVFRKLICFKIFIVIIVWYWEIIVWRYRYINVLRCRKCMSSIAAIMDLYMRNNKFNYDEKLVFFINGHSWV